MKTKISIVLIGLAFLSLNFSCSKKTTPIIQIDTDVEENFSYKIGTYWTYRDSLTGQIDSFAVTDNYTIISSTSSDNNYYVENAQADGYKHNLIETPYIRFALHENTVDFTFYNYNGETFYPLFTYPFQSPGTYSDANSIYTIEVLSTFNLHGHNYNNVVKLIRRNGIFYINKNVGIIKFRIFDTTAINTINDTKEMIGYNIVH